MTVVRNVVTMPGGTAAAGALVIVRVQAAVDDDAHAPAYVTTAGQTIADSYRLRAGSDGSWSIDLVANANIIPAGTVYLVDEVVGRSTTRHVISVPATGGPWWVGDILTPAPTAIPMSYPAFLVGIDGGDPSSVYGSASDFDGGTP